MKRREFLRSVGIVTGGGLCATGMKVAHGWTEEAEKAADKSAEESSERSSLPTSSKLVVTRGTDTRAAVRKTIEALGGIEKYVKKGKVVVIKPNIAWNRPPELAANTNPLVVAELVRLCVKAGAKEVKVFDRTCNNALYTYAVSGIEEAAKKEGAKVIQVDETRGFRNLAFPKGKHITEWEVYGPAIDADVFINVPIAKHHSLGTLTLSMKNLFGVIGGKRRVLHQDLHQSVADLCTEIKPTLNVLDATRILKANGPTGGKISDVQIMNTVAASADMVALDSFGATLFGMKAADIGHVRLANEMKLGRMYPEDVSAEEITL